MKNKPLIRGHKQIAALAQILAENGYICGGFARWYLSPLNRPEPYGDLDIYPIGEKGYSNIGKFIKDAGLQWNNVTVNGTTFARPVSGLFSSLPPIQLMNPNIWPSTLEAILATFDFTVCQAGIRVDMLLMGYSPLGIVSDDFDDDEKGLILRLASPIQGQSICARVDKYKKKGYTCSPEVEAAYNANFQNYDPKRGYPGPR